MKISTMTAVVSLVCLLLSFSPGILLTSAAQTGKIDTIPGKQQASLNTQRSLSVYRGIETGDVSALDEFMSPDIIDHASRGDIKGLENLKKIHADIHNHFTNLKFTLISDGMSADGMYHFSLVRITGTTKDASMGMPANTPVDRLSVDIVRLQNGKHVEHWRFDDVRDVMKAMKMMKK